MTTGPSIQAARLTSPRARLTLTVGVLTLLFAAITLRNAWVCDDAYITFRTIDNFVNGFGLTWNIVERVQTYTHPLWMLLNLPVYFFTREAFFSSIYLSLVVSSLAVAMVALKIADSWKIGALAVLALTLSKAFVDFSTSGLENPLTHLLIAAFVVVYVGSRRSLQSLGTLSLIASLAMLNRLDTALLFAPALIACARPIRTFRAAAPIAVGMIPLLLWELFAFFYYGFLFPNTAYAKLNTGIPQMELWQQGGHYFFNSLTSDPLTLTVIAGFVVATIVFRARHILPLAIGVMLYLIYILSIGGDFMIGRYFTAPLFLAVAAISSVPMKLNRYALIGAIAAILCLGMMSPNCPLYTTADYGLTAAQYEMLKAGPGSNRENHNIMDERAFYFPWSSWLNASPGKAMPSHDWANQGRALRGDPPQLVTKSTIGYFGYFAGPHVHVLDDMALGDPLLARLPIKQNGEWIIGHFQREIPDGYPETIMTGQNQIADSNLARYYDKLSQVTQASPWSFDRLLTAAKCDLGGYTYLIERYKNNQAR